MIVLAHLAVLVETLEQFHAVAAHIAYGHPGMLSVFVGDFHKHSSKVQDLTDKLVKEVDQSLASKEAEIKQV